MIAWLKRFFARFTKPKQEPAKPEPVVAPKPPEPVITEPSPLPKIDEEAIDWSAWCRRSMIESGRFEGKGTDWANVVPNFDGAILTCGLLGFTWKWNNQAPMVLKFIERHGIDYFMRLMPKSGGEYRRACILGEAKGKHIILTFSNSKTVFEPYKKELTALWGSEEMKAIQVETSVTMFGNFAKKQAIAGADFFGMPKPTFHHYRYWFDQAVLNGTSKTVSFDRNDDISNASILAWCETATGYTTGDLKKNVGVWREALKSASKDKAALWRMAYLRAQNSRSEFKPVTMNRRGTLALGTGFVNGSKRSLTA